MRSYHPTIFLIKASSIILIKQKGDDAQVDLKLYQQLVGKLIYLVYKTWSNIAFIIKQLSKYNSDSQVKHFYIAKQVLQYLKYIIRLRIV